METSEAIIIIKKSKQILFSYYFGFVHTHKEKGDLFLVLGDNDDNWDKCIETFKAVNKDIRIVCNHILNSKDVGLFVFLDGVLSMALQIKNMIEQTNHNYFPIGFERIDDEGEVIFEHTDISSIHHACKDIAKHIIDAAKYTGVDILSRPTIISHQDQQRNTHTQENRGDIQGNQNSESHEKTTSRGRDKEPLINLIKQKDNKTVLNRLKENMKGQPPLVAMNILIQNIGKTLIKAPSFEVFKENFPDINIKEGKYYYHLRKSGKNNQNLKKNQ